MKDDWTPGCDVKANVPNDHKGRHYDVFEEVVLIIEHLRKQGVLTKISEGVRFARRRFGQYEVIDFLAVLFGYAMSGERTLEAFYERLQPFAIPFMALFAREQLPARSILSRFLAALTEAPVEALRTLFLDDLLRCPLSPDKHTGGLADRAENGWVVFDIDGTREAARQRALPQTDDLPSAFRRLDDVCAPAPSLVKPIVSTGSARSATGATVATGRNCVRASRPLVAIRLHTSSRKSALCYGSTANMAPGLSWQIWQASPS